MPRRSRRAGSAAEARVGQWEAISPALYGSAGNLGTRGCHAPLWTRADWCSKRGLVSVAAATSDGGAAGGTRPGGLLASWNRKIEGLLHGREHMLVWRGRLYANALRSEHVSRQPRGPVADAARALSSDDSWVPPGRPRGGRHDLGRHELRRPSLDAQGGWVGPSSPAQQAGGSSMPRCPARASLRATDATSITAAATCSAANPRKAVPIDRQSAVRPNATPIAT